MDLKSFLNKYTELPDSAFKRLFVLFFFGYLPFLLLHIILTLFEITPVNLNDEKNYGLKAVVILLHIRLSSTRRDARYHQSVKDPGSEISPV